mgnify:CR=1 FL=1
MDVLQIRPIQNIGDSDYQNFNLDKVKSHYDEVFGPLKEYARQHGTMLIIPSKAQLNMLAATEQEPEKSVRSNDHIQDLTYVYAYPAICGVPTLTSGMTRLKNTANAPATHVLSGPEYCLS